MKKEPLIIENQGSFAIGGKTKKHEGVFSTDNFLAPEGQIAYGDHAYVFYQIPVHARPYPMVFQHGGAQCKRTWESTPDGREGFQNIFLRKGYATYLIDQPRIGEAGLALEADDGSNPYAQNPMYADKTMYMLCRCGTFDGDTPVPYADSAMASDGDTYNQFQRSWTPYEGRLDDDVSAEALAQLLEKTGPAIVVTHSMGGTVGWRTPFLTNRVKAIVAFEPGGSPFIFPEGEVPESVTTIYDSVKAQAIGISLDKFLMLTKIPIILYYGDHIADGPTDEIGPDKWRSEFEMAKAFVACVNRHGGKAEIVHLPDIGIKGNTHFLMADRNNEQIADLMDQWIRAQGLL
ncbi:MAG: alpha/beta fold hydrolase [Megasphaera sp.]|jgi:pimeloyl-ACP methyl ester carboxylesterase|nr:alpha/beta fold hydrolase [Megasphaera sp.]